MASAGTNAMRRNGRPATSSSRGDDGHGPGRRMTACASRYQPPCSDGRAVASAARRQRRGDRALTRVPSTASAAGRTTSATTIPASETRIPPIPIDCRKPSGKTSSDAIAAAIVSALKSTVRPAVASVRAMASAAPARHGQLLAVARDDEQAVVDGQPEPIAVTRLSAKIDRARDVAVDGAHAQERGDDRQRPHQRRHERRHEPAEDPERQSEQDREGDHLRPREVLGDLRADGRPDDVAAAEAHFVPSNAARKRSVASSSSASGSSWTRTAVAEPSRDTSPGSRVDGQLSVCRTPGSRRRRASTSRTTAAAARSVRTSPPGRISATTP